MDAGRPLGDYIWTASKLLLLVRNSQSIIVPPFVRQWLYNQQFYGRSTTIYWPLRHCPSDNDRPEGRDRQIAALEPEEGITGCVSRSGDPPEFEVGPAQTEVERNDHSYRFGRAAHADIGGPSTQSTTSRILATDGEASGTVNPQRPTPIRKEGMTERQIGVTVGPPTAGGSATTYMLQGITTMQSLYAATAARTGIPTDLFYLVRHGTVLQRTALAPPNDSIVQLLMRLRGGMPAGGWTATGQGPAEVPGTRMAETEAKLAKQWLQQMLSIDQLTHDQATVAKVALQENISEDQASTLI